MAYRWAVMALLVPEMQQVFHVGPVGHLNFCTLGHITMASGQKWILLLCISDLCSQIHQFLNGTEELQWNDDDFLE